MTLYTFSHREAHFGVLDRRKKNRNYILSYQEPVGAWPAPGQQSDTGGLLLGEDIIYFSS